MQVLDAEYWSDIEGYKQWGHFEGLNHEESEACDAAGTWKGEECTRPEKRPSSSVSMALAE